jgi:hypothetical protein
VRPEQAIQQALNERQVPQATQKRRERQVHMRERGSVCIDEVEVDPVMAEPVFGVGDEGVRFPAAQQSATPWLQRVAHAVALQRAVPFRKNPEVQVRPKRGSVGPQMPIPWAAEIAATVHDALETVGVYVRNMHA